MKNSKLKLALKGIACKKSQSFEVLGIEEIQTIKGGHKEPDKPNGCLSSNCEKINCGWN